MGISFEDYSPRLEERNVKANIIRVEKARIKEGRTQQLREILVDPRWELYAQQIESSIADHASQANSLSRRLLAGVSPQDYAEVLSDYRYHLGVETGLEFALNYIKDLIKPPVS